MEQGQNPLCNKWIQHLIFPICFKIAHPKTYFCPHWHGRSAQGTRPSICLCVHKPTVVQREYQNLPVSAPQPLHAYMNIPLLFYVRTEFQHKLRFYLFTWHILQIVSLGFKPCMHLKIAIAISRITSQIRAQRFNSQGTYTYARSRRKKTQREAGENLTSTHTNSHLKTCDWWWDFCNDSWI